MFATSKDCMNFPKKFSLYFNCKHIALCISGVQICSQGLIAFDGTLARPYSFYDVLDLLLHSIK